MKAVARHHITRSLGRSEDSPQQGQAFRENGAGHFLGEYPIIKDDALVGDNNSMPVNGFGSGRATCPLAWWPSTKVLIFRSTHHGGGRASRTMRDWIRCASRAPLLYDPGPAGSRRPRPGKHRQDPDQRSAGGNGQAPARRRAVDCTSAFGSITARREHTLVDLPEERSDSPPISPLLESAPFPRRPRKVLWRLPCVICCRQVSRTGADSGLSRCRTIRTRRRILIHVGPTRPSER